MIKIESPTLAEAYEEAARKLNCSVADLSYEVIQHPSNGLLGFMKKSAIIVAECNKKYDLAPKRTVESKHIEISVDIEETETITKKSTPNVQPERIKETPQVTAKNDQVLNSFFDAESKHYQEDTKEVAQIVKVADSNIELAQKIENELKVLFSHSCFDIDTIEVDVVDNTALIFIDGNDAALLIGKEGYRYNAISYMLFNWLYAKYNLYLKLEIAQFLTTQHEMIKSYIEPVIEYVKVKGRGKTRPLDGILVQIALEQLREAFPDKYVAVKSSRDGRRFVLINEFNARSES